MDVYICIFDIWQRIILFCDIKTVKNLNLVSNMFNKYVNKYIAPKYYNQLIPLLSKYPNEDWDMKMLTKNLCIPVPFILNNPQYKWDYNSLFNRPDIINYMDIINKTKIIKDYIYLKYGSYDSIIENVQIFDEDIIFSNKNLSIQDINNLMGPNSYLINSYITHKYINYNYNVTKQFIEENLNYNGDHDALFMSKFITLDMLPKFENIRYDWLSSNPNLTIDYILDNMDKHWDWYFVIKNSSFTVEDIMKLKLEDISDIVFNPHITLHELTNLNLLDNICECPNLTYNDIEYLENSGHKLNFKMLSKNNFNYNLYYE